MPGSAFCTDGAHKCWASNEHLMCRGMFTGMSLDLDEVQQTADSDDDLAPAVN